MIKTKIDKRIQIIEVISQNPGVNFCDIMRLTGLKNGVLSHHVGKLEKQKKIKVMRKTNNTRFYPILVSKQESNLLEMLRRPTPREIILLLYQNEDGLTFNDIVTKLDKAQSTISQYLQILIGIGIIYIGFTQRKKIFHIKNLQFVDQVLQKYNTGYLTSVINNFKEIMNSL